MKKSLSLLLAIALVFSMFSSLAFAAEQSSGEYLKEIGVIKGNSSGDLMEDKTWKRQDVVVILSRLLGQEEEAQNTAKNHPFTDVTDPYYDGYITWARDNGYFEGKSATRFGYNDEIELYDFLAVMLRALGYDTKGANYANVDDLALELGWIDEDTDLTVAATRGVLYDYVVATLNSETVDGEILGAKLGLPGFEEEAEDLSIASFKAVGAKKLEVAFDGKVADTSKAKFVVKRGTVSLNIANTEFSADGTKATIELASKLIKGDYTVTVSGVAASDLTATVSVEDEKVASIEISEKASLDRTTNKTIYAWVKVTNQYGEDVTSTYASRLTTNSTVSKGQITGIAPNGKVTISTAGLSAPNDVDYNLEEKVYLNLLYTDTSTGNSAFKSQMLTVSLPAKVATIDIVELVKNAQLNVKADKSKFYFVIDARDQYGNKVDAANIAEDTVATITNPSVFDVERNTTTGEPNYTTDGSGNTILKLEYSVDSDNDGTKDQFGRGIAQLIIMSKTTGNRDAIDVEVVDAAKVDTLSIEIPDILVAGEKVELNYEAYDQFGNALTNKSDLDNGMTTRLAASNVNGQPVTLSFEQDHVAGKAKLYLNSTAVTNLTNATPIFISGVTGTFKNVQLTVTLQPNKVPQVVTGLNNTKRAIAKDGSTGIAFGDILVVDQYGRTHALSSYSGYVAEITLSDASKVSFSNTTADNKEVLSSGGSATLYGKASGSVTATIKLYKGTSATDAIDANYISGSDYTFNVRTVEVSEIESYTVADLGKVYAGEDKTADHKQNVVVEGVLSDGTKVAVPTNNSTYYTVTIPEPKLHYAVADSVTGYVYADDDINPPAAGNEKDYAIVIIGQTKNGSQTIVKTVTVSKVPREATTFDTKDGSATVSGIPVNVVRVDTGVVKVSKAVAQAAASNPNVLRAIADLGVKVTDQYGAAFNNSTELVSVTSSGLSTSIDSGATFTITVVTKNAKHYVFKVVVVD